MQAQGLFSNTDPNLVAMNEQMARQGINKDLAMSSNPFASTMFAGLNMADQFKNQVADVFGNPLEESAAVKAAREEKSLEQEIASMVQKGRAEGKPNAKIAEEVQQYLLSRGKFNKAEQLRTQQVTEEQTSAKNAADIAAKNAAAQKDLAQGREADNKVRMTVEAIEARKKGIKARYPNLNPEIINAMAQDEKVLADVLKGSKEIETAEGVFQLQPDGTYLRVGSPVDRRTTVNMNEYGNKEYVKAIAPELVKTQQQLSTLPTKIAEIDRQIKMVKENPMILGAAAENRVAIANAFATLGISTPDNLNTLTNTKEFIKSQKRLVLADLGGKLGAGIANADRDFIEEQFGQITDNPQALGRILTRIKEMYGREAKQLRLTEKRLMKSIETGIPQAVDEQEIPKPAEQAQSPLTSNNPADVANAARADQNFLSKLPPEVRARIVR